MNTNTPETDAACGAGNFIHCVDDDFARKLERERDEARAKHAADVEELNQRLIKRQQDMLSVIIDLRNEKREIERDLNAVLTSLNAHEAAEGCLTARGMRGAIKEAQIMLENCYQVHRAITLHAPQTEEDKAANRGHCDNISATLAKLQPFLKP